MKFFKKRKKTPENAKHANAQPKTSDRIHNDALGNVWFAITGQNPAVIMPQIIGTVLSSGGTRPPWKWLYKGKEYVAVAWPEKEPLRACAIMSGPEDGELKPVTVVPLIEGLPNDLTVESVHPRKEGQGADVAVTMIEGQNPMWFFDPFYTRDINDLTPGITHTFWLSAVALGIRKAALDEITIVQGPQFEAYVENWLRENPGKQSKDAPPLKLEIKGKHFIMPGKFFGEYQLRALIEKIEECQFEKMPFKICFLSFPFENRPALNIPLFASQFVLGNYEPQTGDEIEIHAWLEGRIIDLEASETGNMKNG